ncbi:MAG: hypothetical protein FWH35_07195 [Treponema sp.]|nr:hypothetical protein [Treponema sp.]
MKSKFGYLVLLVLVLSVFVVFLGCKNGVQEVDGEVKIALVKGNPVDKVTVTKTTDGVYIIVSFDAVENTSSYEVYCQMEGSLEYVYLPGVQNYSTYAKADGIASDNADPDKWSCRTLTSAFKAGEKFRFGVITTLFETEFSSTSSDFTWSDYIKF